MGVKRKYNVNADIIRILAGFGVIFIHVTDPFIVHPINFGIRGLSWEILQMANAFFRMSVPLFVVLSGYLLLEHARHTTITQFYKRRLNRVIVPFLFWLGVHYAWHLVMKEPLTVGEAVNKFITVDLEHLYFVIIILELYFITPVFSLFLSNATKRAQNLMITSSVLMLIMYTAINYLFPDARLSFTTNALFIFIPFIGYYLLGYFIYHLRKINLRFITYFTLYALTAILVGLIGNGDLNSYVRSSGSITVVAMTSILFVGIIQNKFVSKVTRYPRITSVVKHISTSIFGIYLAHMLVLNLIDQILPYSPQEFANYTWYAIVAKSVIVFTASFVIVIIGKRIPYVRYVFG